MTPWVVSAAAAWFAVFVSPVLAQTQAPNVWPPVELTRPSQWCQTARNLWSPFPVLSKWQGDRYREFWSAAGEPSVYAQTKSKTLSARRTYRFTWLRSFDPPIVVRVDETSPGVMRITATEFVVREGSNTAKVKRRLARRLTADERSRFEAITKAADLAKQPGADCGPPGLDGARWVIDANERGRYLFAHRQSPKDGPVRALGLEMLKLTGWSYDPVY